MQKEQDEREKKQTNAIRSATLDKPSIREAQYTTNCWEAADVYGEPCRHCRYFRPHGQQDRMELLHLLVVVVGLMRMTSADDDGLKSPAVIAATATTAAHFPGLELMKRYALVMRNVPSCKDLGSHKYPVHIPVDGNFTARVKAVSHCASLQMNERMPFPAKQHHQQQIIHFLSHTHTHTHTHTYIRTL